METNLMVMMIEMAKVRGQGRWKAVILQHECNVTPTNYNQ